MSGYTKLFSSILTSTIWCQDSDTRVVWITMLASVNRDGIVETTVPGLAKLASVPIDKVRNALRQFEAPDPESRTPESEGRRVEKVAGGWKLLNYEHYRFLQSEEDIREKNRLRQQRWRERNALHGVTKRDDALQDVTRVTNNANNDKAKSIKHINPPTPLERVTPVTLSRDNRDTKGGAEFQSEELKNHPRRCLMPECLGQQRTGLPGMARLFCSEACYDRAKRIDPENIK